MNYSEVRVLWQEINMLCTYVDSKGIDDTVFNIFLNRNKKILKPLNEETESWMPKELKALVDKIVNNIQESIAIPGFDFQGRTPFQVGFAGLTEKEQQSYAKFDDEFVKACEAEECDISVYLYNPDKLDRINLDFKHATILNKFLADDIVMDDYFTKQVITKQVKPVEAVDETLEVPTPNNKMKVVKGKGKAK